MQPHIDIRASREDDRHLLEVAGELDLATGRQLASALNEPIGAAVGPLTIDLTKVSFLDSTGLAAILHGVRRMTRQGRRTLIVCPPGQVNDVLTFARVRDRLEFFETRDAAAQALAAEAGV